MLAVVSADVLGMVTVHLNMSSLCRFVLCCFFSCSEIL